MPDDNKNVNDNDLDDALLGDLGDAGDSDDDNNGVDGNVGNAGDDDDDNNDSNDDDGNIDWKNELNKARSDWGRKQKTLETQIETLTENVNKMIDGFNTNTMQQQTDTHQNTNDDSFDSDEPIPLTMGGLAEVMTKIMSNKQDQNTHQDKAYEDSYMQVISSLGSTYSDKVHKHIVDRMFKDFNMKHSVNSKMDAELNFAKAEAAVLRDARTRKTNPLKGNDSNNPLGGSTNIQQDTNNSVPVKLDAYAQDFIKATGMKEEDAQKALQGDMPLYLRGKVTV